MDVFELWKPQKSEFFEKHTFKDNILYEIDPRIGFGPVSIEISL